MKTIDTGKAKIGFQVITKEYFLWERSINEHDGVHGIIIGKLSEITEEQADGLVKQQYASGSNEFIGQFLAIRPTTTLRDLAKSLGIEESDFDKYLVIKL